MCVRAFFLLAVVSTVAATSEAADQSAPKKPTPKESAWVDVLKLVEPQKHAAAGQWKKNKRELTVDATRAARLTLPIRPSAEYDFRVSFTRNTGEHSIAMIFVVAGKQATFEIDAWGQHLAGIQNINGRSIRENPTRTTGQLLKNGRKYTATVQVRKNAIQTYLDGKLLCSHKSNGSNLDVLALWRISDKKALGIGAYDAATTFHRIEVRNVNGTPFLVSKESGERPKSPPATVAKRPEPNLPSRPDSTRRSNRRKVLIVIANEGFFFREYSEPRQELERAGFQVVVAAARKDVCRPHANSGQGRDAGTVRPDIAVADANAADYAAIVFSGGWGSSMYQYAFKGSYSNRAYNGDRTTKEAVNKLINEFVKQEKYVCALCHGVSVLAWARVNGQSLLKGKNVVAPTRAGPAGIYDGRRAQPPSRWNAEVNGAKLSRPRSIGDPRSSRDDVLIDGKIITAEDDISARELGRVLVTRLKQ